MGNKESFSKDDYYMHIQLIGLNMQKFFEGIKSVIIPEKKIKNYWKFDYNEKETEMTKEIDKYFKEIDSRIDKYNDNLDKNIKDIKIEFREVLIYKIDKFNIEKENGQTTNNLKSKEISSPEVDIILTKLNDLYYTHFMPLVLLLSTNKNKIQLNIDTKKYQYLDPRLIVVNYYNDEPIYIDKIIDKILLRFCSIHNELGDIIIIKDEKNPYDNSELIEEYFPYNINIACIGRFGQGKSTGVNKILKEYKARESSKGNSQTKHLTFYQCRNQPVKILDIPGFEDEKTVQDAVNKFKFCDGEINRIADKLHIILYFLNYLEVRKFESSESPILEEIKKHKSSKIIYVITHSKNNMASREKKDFIRKMKEGLNAIIKDEENILEPTLDNVIFLNFFLDPKTNYQPFGEEELFKKIHDFFIESEDYKESCKSIKLTPEEIEKKANKLRAQAQSLLFYNKIFGAAIGAIPGVDWLVQKYLIKKDVVRKIGKTFGIDVKFIDEPSQNKKKTDFSDYNKKDADVKALKTNVNGEEYVNGTITDNVKEAIKIGGEAGVYIDGGLKIVNGITNFNKMANVAKIATSYETVCGVIAEAATQKANSISWIGRIFTNSFETATKTAAKATQYAEKASNIATTANTYKNGAVITTASGLGLTVVGCALGIGLGGYFTHKFCEDLLDKFVTFYKENIDKINNSYEKAAKYFETSTSNNKTI